MRRYGKVYLTFLRIALIREMQSPLHFIFWGVGMSVNFGLFVYFYRTIYGHVDAIAGWTKYEMLFYRGFAELFFTLFLMLAINNLQTLPEKITTGRLDFVLLKPIHSQFMVSLSDPHLGFALNLVSALGMILYSSAHIGWEADWFRLGGALLFTAIGLVMLYSVCMVIVTLSMWVQRAEFVNQVFFSLFGFLFVPSTVYGGVSRIVFSYALPVLFVFTVPVGLLLDKGSAEMPIATLLLAPVWFAASWYFWRTSVRFYTSAGS